MGRRRIADSVAVAIPTCQSRTASPPGYWPQRSRFAVRWRWLSCEDGHWTWKEEGEGQREGQGEEKGEEQGEERERKWKGEQGRKVEWRGDTHVINLRASLS